jgi:hypothetical protein
MTDGATGAWAPATAYVVGNFRRPTVKNGFRYEVTAISGGGASAGVEPTWPTTPGVTVIDNPARQVTWTCRALTAPRGSRAGVAAHGGNDGGRQPGHLDLPHLSPSPT